MNPVHFVTGEVRKLYHRSTPEPPADPPEADDVTDEANLRNQTRSEAIEAIEKTIDCLDELKHDGIHRHSQKYLGDLKAYLERDMED
jgi:hypothetical protein